VPEHEPKIIAGDQARAILGAVRGDPLEALFTVALALGLRQGEALALRWEDVDLSRGAVSVAATLQRVNGALVRTEPKTRRSRRTLPLTSVAAEALRTHRVRQIEERLLAGDRWDDRGLVFTTSVGTPLDGVSVTHRFQKILERAGLPRYRFHDLRHGTASLLAARGVPARVAMELLGHSDIRTTLHIYTHVGPELARDAVERLDAALRA
jgi:integrase